MAAYIPIWKSRYLPSLTCGRSNENCTNFSRIIMIYKQNDVCANFGNHCGISLLAIGGKLLAKILHGHLPKYLLEEVLPESQ